MGNAVVADRHFDLHPRIHVITQDFEDFTDRIHATRRALGDARHHHLALARPLVHAWRDQDILADAAIVRHHEADVVFDEETTDDIHIARL